MVSSSSIIRKFERMLPGIAHENRIYEQTLEAEWATAAETQRRIREKTDSSKAQLKDAIVIWTITYDFENWTETFVKSEQWNEEDKNIIK